MFRTVSFPCKKSLVYSFCSVFWVSKERNIRFIWFLIIGIIGFKRKITIGIFDFSDSVISVFEVRNCRKLRLLDLICSIVNVGRYSSEYLVSDFVCSVSNVTNHIFCFLDSEC